MNTNTNTNGNGRNRRSTGVQTAAASQAPTNPVQVASNPEKVRKPINIGSDGSENILGQGQRGRAKMNWSAGQLLASFPCLADADFRKPGNHSRYTGAEMFHRISTQAFDPVLGRKLAPDDLSPDSPAWNKNEGMEEMSLTEFARKDASIILPVGKGQLKKALEDYLDAQCEEHFPAPKKEDKQPENPTNQTPENKETAETANA